MKHFKTTTFALIAILLIATMSNAQNSGDTIKNAFPDHSEITGVMDVELPMFTGKEDGLVDSLEAIASAIQDTTLQNAVLHAADVLADTPKDNSVKSWLVFTFGAFSVLFGLWQLISKRLWKESAEEQKAQKLALQQKVAAREGAVKKYQEKQRRQAAAARPMTKPVEPKEEHTPNKITGKPTLEEVMNKYQVTIETLGEADTLAFMLSEQEMTEEEKAIVRTRLEAIENE